MRYGLLFISLAVLVSACADDSAIGVAAGVAEQRTATDVSCDWPQVFGTSDHAGKACASPLTGMVVDQVITQDPDAAIEVDWGGGFLPVHESSPLTSGEFVVVPGKAGHRAVFPFPATNLSWNLQVLRRDVGGALVPQWKMVSTWRPVDTFTSVPGTPFNGLRITNGYEPQFQPAITGTDLWVPTARGSVARLDLATGAARAEYHPLRGTEFDDDKLIVVNALSVAPDGTVWYAIVSFPRRLDDDRSIIRGAWLVSIAQDGQMTVRNWETIATPAVGVAAPDDLCLDEFPDGAPTSGTQPAPTRACQQQRPAHNAPVAFRPNGHPVVLSFGRDEERVAYLIELDGFGNPIASANLRGHLLTGCGVRFDEPPCFGDTPHGFDPLYNDAVAFSGHNLNDSAPVVDPGGGVSIAGYDGGFAFGGDFDARGSILRFGTPVGVDIPLISANTQYGWEVTPTAPVMDDGSWSFYQDFNLFSDFDLRVARLAPDWTPQAFGTIPLDFDANAIDWLDAHIPVDRQGNYYAVNGQGVLVKFAPDGTAVGHVDLPGPDGERNSVETLASYFAWAPDGALLASFAGNVYVIRTGTGPDVPPPARAPSRALRSGVRTKFSGRARGLTVTPQALSSAKALSVAQ